MNTPFVCPVCHGKGALPPGFYGKPGDPVGVNQDQCKACNGTGLVWGYDWSQPVQPTYPQPVNPFQPWQPPTWPQWPYGGGTICHASK